MNGITLFMAFVDAIPVVIFLIAALFLMKDFGKDVKEKGLWNYSFLCSGSLMLFAGAILKLSWKTLYALNVCDYTTLSESFFPMQSIGFCFVAMGVLGNLCKNSKIAFKVRTIYGSIILAISIILIIAFASSKATNYVPINNEVFVYESHMPFLLSTFISFTVVQIGLMCLSIKRNKKILILAFLFSLLFMIAEAIVGSMFDGSSGMHWIAQIINIFAELGLAIGTYGLYKIKHKEE